MMIKIGLAMILESLLMLASLSSPLYGEIVWDNRGERLFGGSASSSERDTRVAESWTADDFSLDAGAFIDVLNALLWVRPVEAEVKSADYMILDEDFNNVIGAQAVKPELERIWCCEFGGGGVFQVTLQVNIELPPGRYYCAVRLVGTGPGCNCQFFKAGRDGGVLGETEGYFQSEYFGYPEWTPVSELFGYPDDFSFWLEGELDQPDCGAIRKVRARTDCERQKVTGRVKTTLPEGTSLA